MNHNNNLPLPVSPTEILFITSYPPRECGIATYSHDLVKALNNKFNQSFTISICALESENEKHAYAAASLPAGPEIKYIFNPKAGEFIALAKTLMKICNWHCNDPA
jgi:hypothetical protein